MSGLESLDGLCGIIHTSATSDQQVRCKYKFGHEGECSWAANDKRYCHSCIRIKGLFTHPVEKYTQKKSE